MQRSILISNCDNRPTNRCISVTDRVS